MDILLLVVAALFGSLISLAGGIVLLSNKISLETIQRYAVPFAAGALLAAAFIDVLPEALEIGSAEAVMIAALAGFIVFFILERLLDGFHHHHEHADKKRTIPLVVASDTVHNAIDGAVIGAAFLVNPAVGFVTAIAIAAHEIPQEIGDFGLLRSMGMRRRNVLLVNLVSALATLVFALLVFIIGDGLGVYQAYMLAVAGGLFIYIAASDIIPTIHSERQTKIANIQTIVLLFGIAVVSVTIELLHGLIEG